MTSASADSGQAARQWLAAVLRGDAVAAAGGVALDAATVLDAAAREGVTTLLHARLAQAGLAATTPAGLQPALVQAAQRCTAQHMLREHQCRQIVQRLDAAGLPLLLLKGSALAYLAYPAPHLRECSDIDLLLPTRAAVEQAVTLLGELGYTLRDGAPPGDLVAFEFTCIGRDGLEVDLHWRLSSTPAFAFRYDWDELQDGARALPALGAGARGLAPVAACLHACMHRVQNMAGGHPDKLKWLFDLDLLGRGFTARDWQALVREASARGLAGSCLDGLDAAAACLGAVAPDEVRNALAAAAAGESLDPRRMHQWFYIQRASWRAFPSHTQRLRWLRQRLLPDAAHLRARHGEGGLLRLMLRRLRAGLARL